MRHRHRPPPPPCVLWPPVLNIFLFLSRNLRQSALRTPPTDLCSFFENVPGATHSLTNPASAGHLLVDYPPGMHHRQGLVVALASDGARVWATLQGGNTLEADYALVCTGSSYPSGVKADPTKEYVRADRLKEFSDTAAKVCVLCSVWRWCDWRHRRTSSEGRGVLTAAVWPTSSKTNQFGHTVSDPRGSPPAPPSHQPTSPPPLLLSSWPPPRRWWWWAAARWAWRWRPTSPSPTRAPASRWCAAGRACWSAWTPRPRPLR